VLFAAVIPARAKTILRIGRSLEIAEGQRVDNAVAIGGQITVNGLVDKRIITIGGSVVVTSKAVVRGNITCIGGVVVVGSGAQIYGKVREINSTNILEALSSFLSQEDDEWLWFAEVVSFCFFLTFVAFALLTAILFPRPLMRVAQCIRGNKFKSFFWGALATLLSVPFFMLLVLSFIGIALIPLVFSLMLSAFMFGFIAVSSLLGKFVLTNIFIHHKHSLVRETLLGLILWWVLGWLPFYSGMVIKAIVITMGFGGVLLAVFHREYSA